MYLNICIDETKLPLPDFPSDLGRIRVLVDEVTDEIPMEVIKELDGESMQINAKKIEVWWERDHIDQKYLRPTVWFIYKKGNTSMLENYRPISLLNCLYKIFAAIVQKRMAAQIDEYLQRTHLVSEKTEAQQMQYIV